jgi:transcriptional regulator PpsR
MRSAADQSIISEPDITLVLDENGVIEKATLSQSIADEKIESWVGRSWSDIVGGAGGEKVKRIIEDACRTGVSAFRQITQPFPSGLELPFEYTAVRLENKRSLVAIGKNLKAVAELQTRLIAAQQLMERDYWRLREVEGRYRLLFDASTEPVVLVSADTVQIVEANPAAVRVLDLPTARRGRVVEMDFLALVPARERPALSAMLARVRQMGRAPGVLAHVGERGEAWVLRASLTGADSASEFVVQFAPAGAKARVRVEEVQAPFELFFERAPDAMAVVDSAGLVLRANRSFLDLIGATSRGEAIGEPLSRWLSQPGADAAALLANVARHRFVRLMPTVMSSKAGLERLVEISATADSDANARFVFVAVRDVERRLSGEGRPADLAETLRRAAGNVGITPLRQAVQETIDVVENHYVRAALEASKGNRTAAAEMLGLSRQSLYAKLDRYAIEPEK